MNASEVINSLNAGAEYHTITNLTSDQWDQPLQHHRQIQLKHLLDRPATTDTIFF
jgi:hypothetical protein